MKEITYKEYLDKTHGGWFGKCLGGAAGSPVEGIKGSLDVSMREIMDPNIPNDDLDIQLLWLELLEQKGPYFDSFDMALKWEKQCWYPFGEYGIFLKNFERRIAPPYSGKFNNQYFFEGMGCPIRSEIWGMINPGRPGKAGEMAFMDGSLDHYGNSVWAEIFLAALESNAYFESDIETLIADALSYVKEECKFKKCIEQILDSYKKGESYEKILREIQMDYSHPDFTNSVQNMGYSVLALLFGEKDIEKTVNLALRCGYDADCTCATVGAIIGIINGYESIPDELKELLDDKFVCGIDVERPDNLISTLAKDTCRIGMYFSKIYNDVSITDCKECIVPTEWENRELDPELTVEYEDEPAIGFFKPCKVRFVLNNKSGKSIEGTFKIEDIPQGWDVDMKEKQIALKAAEKKILNATFAVKSQTDMLNQINIMRGLFIYDNKEISKDFGIAGSIAWMVNGPHIEARKFTPKEGVPNCHGSPDINLPSVETIFSNQADPEKEYINEEIFISGKKKFQVERIVEAPEDLIPIDNNFGVYGEATFYLKTHLVFPEDMKTWVVVGNSDAYKLWINGKLIQQVDECRTWQPQAHGDLVSLKKGVNKIAIKLTKRSEILKFSIGFSGNEEKHYHAQKWIANYSCLK